MGFEEQLKQNTKSVATLENEQKVEQEKRIRYMAQIFVRAFSMACQGAAEAGKRSMKMGIPVHLDNQFLVHGGNRYNDNESYIAHCYNCASENALIFHKWGFYCPCDLQTFNVADKADCVDYYTYPRSYADSLVTAIRSELKRNDFTNAKIVFLTGTDDVERHFFRDKKVHKPFTKGGVTYFYMGIETEW